jgi:ABC-type multidrug transport system, permease component
MAIAKKDLTQAVRYPTWILALIIWPLIFPLLYILSAAGMAGPDYSGIGTFEKVSGTGSFQGFIVIGTMVWMWVNTTMWGFGTYLRDEQTRGTLESNWLCPIKKFDLLMGGGVISALQAVLIFIVSLLEYRYIYGIHFTGSILSWIVLFIIMVPGVYGLGTMFASLVLWVKETGAAVQLVRGIMMILCGITFPTTIMPYWMQWLSKLLPFTYGISAARVIMIDGGSFAQAIKEVIICLCEGIILLIIGRICFAAVENKVKNIGSLERF